MATGEQNNITETERLRREKISKTLKGFKRPPFSTEHIEKLRKSSTGRKHKEESKKKVSDSLIGNKRALGSKHTEEWKAEARKRKPSLGKPNNNWIGSKNPNWKGGITPINLQIRHSLESKIWRRAVFERDNYTCIWCGKRGVYIEADHIKPFCDYPELRFAIDNGRTLCKDCHKTTDTYAGKSKKR